MMQVKGPAPPRPTANGSARQRDDKPIQNQIISDTPRRGGANPEGPTEVATPEGLTNRFPSGKDTKPYQNRYKRGGGVPLLLLLFTRTLAPIPAPEGAVPVRKEQCQSGRSSASPEGAVPVRKDPYKTRPALMRKPVYSNENPSKKGEGVDFGILSSHLPAPFGTRLSSLDTRPIRPARAPMNSFNPFNF
jgi:hypothetical protein